MALATLPDVETALGRPLTATEQSKATPWLDEASDLVIGYLHPCPIADPTPDPIKRVVASMVSALLTPTTTANLPSGATSIAAGPYSVGLAPDAAGTGPVLTARLKMRLRPYRCGNGMVSVGLGSERA
ncbi:hypothetical protein ACFWQG_13070 [Rhodococcus sp. NPDC058532]|uniref:hypothetical protein n=1 Tax=Rhodococcus sp. NPDC058532 TaxID=3346540 RepID=UPI003648A748